MDFPLEEISQPYSICSFEVRQSNSEAYSVAYRIVCSGEEGICVSVQRRDNDDSKGHQPRSDISLKACERSFRESVQFHGHRGLGPVKHADISPLFHARCQFKMVHSGTSHVPMPVCAVSTVVGLWLYRMIKRNRWFITLGMGSAQYDLLASIHGRICEVIGRL